MKLKEILKKSALEFLPVILMIALIPIIKNDYYLLLSYIIIILISFKIKYEKNESYIFISSLILMIFFEWLFVSTGVEIFLRTSLLGIMPIWLPFLWAYGWVAGKRFVLFIK